MSWDFSTEPEFEKKLDWIREFVREEVEPLEVLFPGCEFLPLNDERRRIVDPLKQQVRDNGLWAPHLGPELGGQGFGAVKLTLINEILGRSPWAPIVFGTQAPDTGNADVARFGTQDQKDRYLGGLLSGEIFSALLDDGAAGRRRSAGLQDPCRPGRRRLGDHLGESTSPPTPPSPRSSSSSGSPIRRACPPRRLDVPDPGGHPGPERGSHPPPGGRTPHEPGHSLVHYDGVRVPSDALLGEPGQGFLILQTRLAGGRLHHAMRSIGVAQRAVEMMSRRAKSRFTQGSSLADKQLVQAFIADSYTELMPFRLAVLHAAWLIDTAGEHAARAEIGACKILASQVLKSIGLRAIQVHGALGTTDQMPLVNVLLGGVALGLADGPTEAHKVNLARLLLKNYEGEDPEWPSEMLDIRRAAARVKYGFEHVPVLPDSR